MYKFPFYINNIGAMLNNASANITQIIHILSFFISFSTIICPNINYTLQYLSQKFYRKKIAIKFL